MGFCIHGHGVCSAVSVCESVLYIQLAGKFEIAAYRASWVHIPQGTTVVHLLRSRSPQLGQDTDPLC